MLMRSFFRRSFTQTQLKTVFRAELLHFGRDPIIFRMVVLLPLSILVAVWQYSGSSLIPAIASALVILEPRFNNFLFTSPAEGQALLLFPSRWREIIAAKNLAAAVLLFLLVPILAIAIGFFGLRPPVPGDWLNALLYLLTILFPLWHLGNLHTVQHPRRKVGWSLGDLSDAIFLLFTAGLASIPYAILSSLRLSPLWCSLYALGSAVLWWRVSLPRTARLLREGSILMRLQE
jgi:hypothetical protein